MRGNIQLNNVDAGGSEGVSLAVSRLIATQVHLRTYSSISFSEIPASRGRPTEAKSMSQSEWKKPEFR
jgi:hypothetical protein